MAATDPQEVLQKLKELTAVAMERHTRIGYFSTLYEVMTARLIAEIRANRFADAPRVERLIVVFAQRYFASIERFWSDKQPSRCWRVAFLAAPKDELIILQHILLGMNAHINFDLAIAVAEVAPGLDAMTHFKGDYDHVNDVLDELLDIVQRRLNRVSPVLEMLDELGGRSDEAIAGFSMQKARASAWESATLMQRLKDAPLAREGYLSMRDSAVAGFGQAITNPLVCLAVVPIRIAETSSIPEVIDAIRDAK